ncbi:MAG: hypothetical protein GY803_11595 [Chloroflexi bacterium]|nr:hypothetical protein [Chloroflexota bacterium]
MKAFSAMYRNSAGEFPSGVAERAYYERMQSAYPIHPELFDRLYQDWSTLERFQRTRGVLRLMAAAIHQLWTHNGVIRGDAPFAYATGVGAEGYHSGLVFRSPGQIFFDDQSLLVHPEHTQELPPPPKPDTGPLPPTSVSEGKLGAVDTAAPQPPPEPKATTRYYGRVKLDPQRVNQEMGLVVEEVIERLTSLVGCDLEIVVEISAEHCEGFNEATIRTVSENSQTLKFEHYGFEED